MKKRRIERALWGIQHQSFADTVTYLQRKHDQAKTKLTGKLDEIRAETNQIHQQIGWLQASHSGKEDPPQPVTQADALDTVVPPRKPQLEFQIQWKKRLFGLNQKSAMGYITNLIHLQEKEILELQEEMSRVRNQREALKLQLSHYQNVSLALNAVAASVEVPEENLSSAFVEEMKERLLSEIKEIKEILMQGIVSSAQLRASAAEKVFVQPAETLEAAAEEVFTQPTQTLESILVAFEPKEKSTAEDSVPLTQLSESAPKPVLPQKRMSAAAPKKAAPPISRPMAAVGSGFWEEDIEQLLFEPRAWTTHQVSFIHGEPLSERGDKVHSPVYEPHAETRRSQAAADHAHHLKKKYIVGKIAGKDLSDGSGGLIVSKNAVITEDVLSKAEREGKLAELIVNMVIPGSGE